MSALRRVLFDRGDEVGEIEAAITRPLEGEGVVVVVEGPPGIGKTALLEHAAASARERGLLVLRARGNAVEASISFGVVRQLLESARRRRIEELLDRAVGQAFQAAAPEDARFQLIHELFWALVGLSDRQPLAVVIDDAHWADEPSLDWLAYVARRVTELPVGMIVATRPMVGEAPMRWPDSSVLAEARVVRPRPLSRPGTAEFLEHALGEEPADRFVDACHRRTGGNPLLLAELTRALATASVRPTENEEPRVADLNPATVRRAVRARLAHLPGSARALAEAAAILDGAGTLDDAAELAEVARSQAVSDADRLVTHGLLTDERLLTFAHPLVRDAVYLDIPPHRRATMHALAATRLATRIGSPEVAAAHFLVGDAAGRPEAVEVLLHAARNAIARGAPQSAVAYLRRAVAEPPGPEQARAIGLELGVAELLAGEDEAIARLEDGLAGEVELELRVVAAKWLGVALMLRGRAGEAYERIRETLEDIPPGREDLRLELEAEAATHAVFGAGGEDALARLRSAAERLDGRTPAERALLALSLGAHRGESLDELVTVCRAALGDGLLVAEQGPERPHVHLVLDTLMDADRFDLAEQALNDLDAEAARRGSAVGLAAAANAWAWWAWTQGQLLRAEANARAALDAEPGTAPMLGSVAFLAEVLRERGELDAADAVLREHGMDGALPDAPHLLVTRLARGRLHAAQGRLDDALADFEEIGRQDAAAGRQRQFPWRSSAAEALAAAGQRGEAIRLAEEEHAMARGWGAPRPLGIALTALGRVCGDARGRLHLEEAIRILEGSSQQLELARALVSLGQLTRAEGRRTEARELLRRGHALATRHGALVLARLAETELRVAGGRPRRAQFSGPESLTASERRVAELAIEGLTNREISQALFVTRKTVEKHLGEAYRKLEIAGRAELAAALARDT